MSVLAVLLTYLAYICNGAKLPSKTMGFYCLIADDTVPGYTSTSNWTPQLYDFQINGTNVIFLTFINPEKMPAVPPAMATLAQCKGKPGCPPATTPVIFSIGGQAYSTKPWSWLSSVSAAESMAAEVATWDEKYGCDGVDLDIEGGAGNSQTSAQALVAFAKKLRSINPNLIITQPVYGYPQVTAEDTMVNQGFTAQRTSNGLVDAIGIMEYNDDESIMYVKNYGNGTSQWVGFPITVNVPYEDIICGIQGTANDNSITHMAGEIKQKGLGGMMVWLSSVFDPATGKMAFTYGNGGMDASKAKSSAWEQAKNDMK
eukprot:802006_1